VILDTFKNTETLAFHKDVSIVYNDGQQSVEAMMENKAGCDANIRYHEDRGDFSVSSASRLKIVVTNGKSVAVSVDAKNDGNFVTCANMDLPFAEDWAEKAYVGITASTGQLADNHDVLSLVTFSDIQKHEQYIEQIALKPAFERGLGFNMERFERMEDKISELQETIDFLHHKLEHELAAIEDHMKITTGKLQAQEAISEGRIDELEKKIKNSISSDVSGKLSQLTNSMDDQVMSRIKQVEEGMKQKISESMDSVEGLGGGWKLPFFILFFMMCMGGFGLFKWYQQLKKTHML
jgi:lectin, mannose-binding 2